MRPRGLSHGLRGVTATCAGLAMLAVLVVRCVGAEAFGMMDDSRRIAKGVYGFLCWKVMVDLMSMVAVAEKLVPDLLCAQSQMPLKDHSYVT